MRHFAVSAEFPIADSCHFQVAKATNNWHSGSTPFRRFLRAIYEAVQLCYQIGMAGVFNEILPAELEYRIMKLVIAIIQPTKLRAVKQALIHTGVERITICDSQEFAKHVERDPIYRGLEYRTNILRKITIEIAVNEDYLERTLHVIEHVAKTGSRGTDGDGKIFVLNMEDVIQIGPETRGPGAI